MGLRGRDVKLSYMLLTFQVEALQEGIGRLRSDIKEAKGRGEEKERQQREQGRNSKEGLSFPEGFYH